MGEKDSDARMSSHAPEPKPGGMSTWLIHCAALRAPRRLSSRLEEEWRADLESRRSALSRLRFALGCCWATVVIVREFPQAAGAMPSALIATRGFIAPDGKNFAYASLRSSTLFLIVWLHVAVFSGLIELTCF
jgi:hypothetical protein